MKEPKGKELRMASRVSIYWVKDLKGLMPNGYSRPTKAKVHTLRLGRLMVAWETGAWKIDITGW
jgi:hypothetical protein